MPTILQLRRGTTTEHASFTGAEGEITVDTTKDTLVVHDGSTQGGFELALADGTNVTVSTEQVQDAAAGMITSASHTNITATYDDSAGTLSLAAAASYGDSDVGTYLSSNGFATQSTIVAAITDSAPATLDTLNELAAALGDDANFASTTTSSLAAKAPLAGPTFTGTVTLPSTTSIGDVSSTEISYVNGVTSAIQTQLDAKADVDELPSQITAVATGAIVNGDPVVLNSDGTVSSVAETGTSRARLTSETLSLYSQSGSQMSYNVANDKLLHIYKNGSAHMYARVGTIESDNTVTWATAVRIGTHAVSSEPMIIIYDPVEEDHVVFYNDTGNNPKIHVLTISGNAVSGGTQQSNTTFDATPNGASYDSRTSCIVAVGRAATLLTAKAAIFNRTGTHSITLAGSFNIDDTYPAGTIGDERWDMDIVPLDTAGRFLFHGNIKNGTSSNNPRAAVISINSAGTSGTVGSFLDIESATAGDTTLSSALNGKVTFEQIDTDKVAFMFMTTNGGGQLAIASVSGDTITFGQPANLISGTLYASIASDLFWLSSQSELIITYADSTNNYDAIMTSATVSGTTITLSSASDVTIHSTNPGGEGPPNSVLVQSSGKLFSLFTNLLHVTQTYDLVESNLTNTNYLGIAKDGFANGANAVIQTVGSIDDAQTGLVAGSTYFVQGDGTLATTVDSSYSDIKVFAGTAMSATDIRVAKSDAVLQARISLVETTAATNTGNISSNTSSISANRIDIYNAAGTLLN